MNPQGSCEDGMRYQLGACGVNCKGLCHLEGVILILTAIILIDGLSSEGGHRGQPASDLTGQAGDPEDRALHGPDSSGADS